MYVYVYQMNVSIYTCMYTWVCKCGHLIAWMDACVYLRKKEEKKRKKGEKISLTTEEHLII